MHQAITNPAGAYVTTSDYRTGRDSTGGEHAYGKTTRVLRANATVTKGQLVCLVAPTQTLPLSVTPSAGTESGLIFGIAAEGGSAGDLVTVVTEGLAFAIVGTAATAGNAIKGGAAGVVTNVTPAATDIVGTVVGVALATGTTGNTIPVWVKIV